MRPRSGAILTIVAGFVGLVLAASASHRPGAAAATSGPPSATPARSRALPIDWGSAGQQARSGVNERGRGINFKFIAANRAVINQITIPVLLPTDPNLAAGLRIFPNGDFYTVSTSAGGMSLVLTGGGRAFPLSPATAGVLPNGDLAARIPADGVVIEQTEAGIDASFTRFGAAYSIALECAKSHADPRCKTDAYVRGVIARLMVVVPTAGGGA